MRLHGRALLQTGAFLALGLASTPSAWGYYEESHLIGDAAHLTVASNGVALVEHSLTWRLLAGQPHTIDLLGTEPLATPESATSLVSDDGRSIPASVTPLPGKGLRVTVLEPKSLRHGLYQLKVAYSVNLADAGELTREGSKYRLLWKSPVPTEGYEGPKVVFSLPPALEPPAALMGAGGMRDDGVAATLKRDPVHDDLELSRPHIGRGEEVLWAASVSAKAFDSGSGPVFARPPPPPLHDDPPPVGAWAHALLAALAAAFAASVVLRDRSARGSLRGLVPLPSWERATAGGAALFAGASLQLADARLAGSALVALAMMCATARPQKRVAPPRGPGRWLALRPVDVFPDRGPSGLRRLAPLGWVVAAAGVVLAFAFAGFLLRAHEPEAPLVLPLDALAFLPLLVSILTPARAPASAGEKDEPPRRWLALAPLFEELRHRTGLRASPWARVPVGGDEPDEVRVLVVPREPMPGLVGIEIGLPSDDGLPELLVRVQEATAASAKMTSLCPDVVPVPGRKPEERVYRVAPALPTRRGTVALVTSLVARLAERRHSEAGQASESGERDPWTREERRAAIAMEPAVT